MNLANPKISYIAEKILIKDIHSSEFLRPKDNHLSYLQHNGKHISRVNVIGIIVHSITKANDIEDLIIDDGSGSIILRNFDKQTSIISNEIGSTVLVIGKIRQFSDERYIAPEIIKKLNDTRWMQLRAQELAKQPFTEPKHTTQNPTSEASTQIIKEMVLPKPDNFNKIYNIIKNNDPGQGINVEDILQKYQGSNGEKIIQTLLEEGEVFEINPGRIKVLE